MKFSEAAEAYRCDEMWRLYSSATQETVRPEVHRIERERAALPRPEGPEERDCPGYMGYELQRGSVRTLHEDAGAAPRAGARPRRHA
jgi:hypothetical protein